MRRQSLYNSFMARRAFKAIQEAVVSLLASRREVQAAYIFGSVATGRPRPDSDVDIAVLVSRNAIRRDELGYRLKLMADLMDVLKRNDVDLIVLNHAPPLLAHRVLSKGKLIFERSPSARVAFQVQTVNRYIDSQPMRNLYLAYLKKHAEEGKIFG
jgi:predicted nucleotidyltransferase